MYVRFGEGNEVGDELVRVARIVDRTGAILTEDRAHALRRFRIVWHLKRIAVAVICRSWWERGSRLGGGHISFRNTIGSHCSFNSVNRGSIAPVMAPKNI